MFIKHLWAAVPFNNNLAIISIASYLINKGEHTVFYKININVYIKT